MRHLFAVGMVIGLLPAGRGAEDAKAVVERGIKAQGGPAAVKARATAEHRLCKGALFIQPPGADTPLRFAMEYEEYEEACGRERDVLRVNGPEIRFNITSVFDRKKYWMKINDDLKEQPAEEVAKHRSNAYHEGVALLHGLLEEKAFGFTPLGESKVEGKPALGVAVTRKGRANTTLYFDKATGHLVRFTYPSVAPGKEGKKTAYDGRLSDYREVDFGAADERLLKENKLETTANGLLELLRKRAPDPDAAKKIKEWIEQLGSDDFKVRERATADLVALGAAAGPALKLARRSRDPEVARRAVGCLRRIAPARQERQLLAAVRLVAVRRVAGATRPLLALLPGATDAVAREVQETLYHLATQGAKPDPALVTALADKNAAVRTAAERVLGKDGGEFAKRSRRVYPRGINYAMKKTLYVDGKKVAEQEILEVHFYNRFDDSLFAQP